MLCATWYHWYNLKNLKNIYGGVFLLQSCRLQSSIPPWVFFTVLSSTNGTKSRKASHLLEFVSLILH